MFGSRKTVDVCPLDPALMMLGGRWRCIAILHLSDGDKYFNELSKLMPTTSRKVLTETLRSLERDGLVTRTESQSRLRRVRYAVTPIATELLPMFEQLTQWWERNHVAVTQARTAYDD
ncbi:MAG: helix-turn-helix domain-containing protein [Acidobacteriota bacterium]